MKKYKEGQKELHGVLADLEKAYDAKRMAERVVLDMYCWTVRQR